MVVKLRKRGIFLKKSLLFIALLTALTISDCKHNKSNTHPTDESTQGESSGENTYTELPADYSGEFLLSIKLTYSNRFVYISIQ